MSVLKTLVYNIIRGERREERGERREERGERREERGERREERGERREERGERREESLTRLCKLLQIKQKNFITFFLDISFLNSTSGHRYIFANRAQHWPM
jgi:hypothetical protein